MCCECLHLPKGTEKISPMAESKLVEDKVENGEEEPKHFSSKFIDFLKEFIAVDVLAMVKGTPMNGHLDSPSEIVSTINCKTKDPGMMQERSLSLSISSQQEPLYLINT